MSKISDTSSLIRRYYKGDVMGPGFWDIPAETYHARAGVDWPITLSKSTIHTMVSKSPLHAWYEHPQLGGNSCEASAAMDFGDIVHQLILGKGDGFAVGEFDDWRTKAAREFKEDARAAGKTPILAHKLDECGAMVDAFERQVCASDQCEFYHPDCISELAMLFPADGALCQSLIDRTLLLAGKMWDVKTCPSAHPKAIAAKIAQMGYDIQSELYQIGYETLLPQMGGRSGFVFLFVETTPPYVVTPVTLSGEARAVADFKIRRAIPLWKDCLIADEWPAYGNETLTINPPPWALNAEIEAGLYDQ
jgi:hypothetical protein